MTLDLNKIAPQIGQMVEKLKSGSQANREHLKCALDKLTDHNLNQAKLKMKIAESQNTTAWPVAGLCDNLDFQKGAASASPEYTVIATDGSHIDIDRNQPAHCFLINIGTVRLHYGAQPAADLESYPRLFSDEPDLIISDPSNRLQQQRIQGTLLDAKRSVEECRMLAEMAQALTDKSAALALMDGSLVFFGLESFPGFVVEELLSKGFLKDLDLIKNLNREYPLALASYISNPQSIQVVNALKVAICPHEKADCEKYCSENKGPCEAISGIQDRDIFGKLLRPGERSARFINPSEIVGKYGVHKVYFFYLRVEDEIARMEIPEWVAMKPDLLDLAHSLVVDQCRRGQGYPVALSEAHEKAVITGADREEFWGLVEESLVEQKLPISISTKSRSKKNRWI